MRKIGSMLIFAGVVLLIGPFFGFTIRGGAQNFSMEENLGVGTISILVGFAILWLRNNIKWN
jgi:membrane protein DedA with SNARE-associated domain